MIAAVNDSADPRPVVSAIMAAVAVGSLSSAVAVVHKKSERICGKWVMKSTRSHGMFDMTVGVMAEVASSSVDSPDSTTPCL